MTEIKKQEKNTVYFEMVLTADEIANAEKKVYKKNGKYFNIPGFRKGKAPKQIIENMYGKEVFFEDAINELLPAKYSEALEELKLDVVDQPKVDIKDAEHGKDVVVEFSVDVKPEVELKDYKGIEVEEVKYEVTDELINNELETQRHLNARLVNVDDRAAEKGDKVNIDFEGFVDEKPFEGGKAEGQDLELGSNTFIEGFEDQIIGHKAGESFDVNVKFPEDYFSEELKGKDATFKVVLNTISYEDLPELDDEFIKDISEFETVEEYKNDLRAKKEKEFEENAKAERENLVLSKIVEGMEVEVPEGMIKAQLNSQLNNFDQSLRQQGFSLEEYVKMLGSTVEDFAENLRPEAEKQVKTGLALDKIIELENIEVSEDEIEKDVKEMVEQYFENDEEQQKKMLDFMLETNKPVIIENLKNRKAIDLVVENAKFVEKEAKEDK